MLDADLKTQLKSYLENLRNPIELRLTVSDDEASQKMKQLGEDIASLSDSVSVNFDGSAERTPSMEILSDTNGSVLTFSGIPLGHEFTSLVLALLHSGGHPMKVDEDLIEQVRSLEGEFVFESFISLSCQTCPDVVQALNMMSVINPSIKATMVDGALFQEEIESKNIQAVPSVFLNGESFGQGRMTMQDIVNKIDANADQRAAEKLAQKDEFDMLIIGGGPAGASAAIYSARKGFNTGILSERFGGQVADTVGIENFISVSYTEGPKLVASLEQHVGDYDVDVMNSQRVEKIDKGDSFTVTTEGGGQVKAKSIVLATGARWRKMNVPGENEYSGKGVAYCPHCDGPLFKGKRVAVIGGGNSGIEAAIDLANIVEHVTVLEFSDVLRADDVLQRKAKSMSNIDIIMQAQTTEVLGDGERVTGLRYTDRADNSSHDIELAGIFVQIGLVPNSEFLKDVVDLSDRGEVIVGDRGETSVPGIFAAGDVTTVPYKQIIIAMGEGSKAALGAFDYLMRLEPTNKIEETESNAERAA